MGETVPISLCRTCRLCLRGEEGAVKPPIALSSEPRIGKRSPPLTLTRCRLIVSLAMALLRSGLSRYPCDPRLTLTPHARTRQARAHRSGASPRQRSVRDRLPTSSSVPRCLQRPTVVRATTRHPAAPLPLSAGLLSRGLPCTRCTGWQLSRGHTAPSAPLQESSPLWLSLPDIPQVVAHQGGRAPGTAHASAAVTLRA